MALSVFSSTPPFARLIEPITPAPGLPPIPRACEAVPCLEEPHECMWRCSICKTRFYCSERCADVDSAAHEDDCSVLLGDSESAKSYASADLGQLDADVARASAALMQWSDARKLADENAQPVALIPESQALLNLSLSLSKAYEYERAPKDANAHPYRHTIVSITRLLLTDLVTHLSPAVRDALAVAIDTLIVPSSYLALYGPKIVAQPADLSPGEYLMIATVFPIFLIMGPAAGSVDDVARHRWVALSVACKTLWKLKGR